ncbi:MAG: CBS domain-containing protein [Haloarculaceae archaeon]
MPIEDLARSNVVTASADATVTELAATMAEEDVGSVVVTDGDDAVGIVTDRDLAVRVLAEETDPSVATAGDVMSTDLQTVHRGAGFYEATERMREYGVRRLPVVDSDDGLVGIITGDDLTELLADEQQQFAEVIRAQRPPY